MCRDGGSPVGTRPVLLPPFAGVRMTRSESGVQTGLGLSNCHAHSVTITRKPSMFWDQGFLRQELQTWCVQSGIALPLLGSNRAGHLRQMVCVCVCRPKRRHHRAVGEQRTRTDDVRRVGPPYVSLSRSRDDALYWGVRAHESACVALVAGHSDRVQTGGGVSTACCRGNTRGDA